MARRGREYKELLDLFTYSLLIVCFLVAHVVIRNRNKPNKERVKRRKNERWTKKKKNEMKAERMQARKKRVEMKRKEGRRWGKLEGAGWGGGTKTKMTKEINKKEEMGLVTF